jgi:DNA-binding transcriptional LysR family regulator
MDRFEEMRAFTAVVEAGSFVRAAEALHVSKTAVSRLIGELESRLGVRLLHRTTRRLSLTVEGEAFHARCRELLAGVDEAEAEVTAGAGEAIGQLRVNVPVSFGLMHLAPLWPTFMQQNPKVTLDVAPGPGAAADLHGRCPPALRRAGRGAAAVLFDRARRVRGLCQPQAPHTEGARADRLPGGSVPHAHVGRAGGPTRRPCWTDGSIVIDFSSVNSSITARPSKWP